MKPGVKQIVGKWTVRGVEDKRPIPFPGIERRGLDKRRDRA